MAKLGATGSQTDIPTLPGGLAAGLVPVSDGAGGVTWTTVGSAQITNDSVTVGKTAKDASGLAAGAFHAYRNAALSAVSTQIIVFDTETLDVSGWFDTATGRFTPQVKGVYEFKWSVYANAAIPAGSYWQTAFHKNAVDMAYGQLAVSEGTRPLNSVGSTVAFANGTTDYFNVAMIGSHGQNVPLAVGNPATTFFAGSFIGRQS